MPRTVTVCDKPLSVRTDYRDILNIFAALADPDLSEQEKGFVTLFIFYVNPDEVPEGHTEEAMTAFREFAEAGVKAESRQGPTLMDWEKDYPLIAPEIDRILGCSTRDAEYIHWWTYMGAFRNVRDGLFSRVVAVRKKRAEGKLDKSDWEFLRDNYHLVELPTHLTDEETQFFKELGVY